MFVNSFRKKILKNFSIKYKEKTYRTLDLEKSAPWQATTARKCKTDLFFGGLPAFLVLGKVLIVKRL